MKKSNSFEEKLKEQLEGTEWKPSDSLWSQIEQGMDSFEPAMQKKLSDYSVEPNKEVWEQVDARLPESRRRRGFIWFGSVVMVLLLTFGAGYWFSRFSENGTYLGSNQNQEITMNQKPLKIDGKTNPKEEKIYIAENETPASTRVNEDIGSNTESNRTGVTEVPDNENAIIENSESVQVNSNKSEKPARTLVNPAKKQSSASKSVKGKSNYSITNSTGTGKKSKSNSPAVLSSSSIPPANAGNSENKGTESDKNTSPVSGADSSSQKINGGLESGNLKNGNLAQTDEKKKGNEPILIPESGSGFTMPKDTGYSEDKTFRGTAYIAPEESFTNFSLSAMAGIHMSYMSLSMPSSSTFNNLDKSFELRKEMESPQLDFNGGLYVNYHFGKGWFATTGIGVTSFKQIVEFSVIPAQNTGVQKVQPINQYVNVNDSIIAGKGNTLENKYSFTEIPLWIGYKFKSEAKIHFELAGGFSYAKLNLVNAYMPDPSCVGILIVNDKASFPEFKNVFFAGIAPGVSFEANSSVELGMMLNAKMALNNMVDNSQWIQQRPSLLGINLFLRKRF